MRRFVLALMCLVSVGCEGKSLVEYDPLRDSSKVSVSVGDFSSGNPYMHLLFTGDGKHPSGWSCMVFLRYHASKDEVKSMGEKMKIVFNPRPSPHVPYEFEENCHEDKTFAGKHEVEAIFGIKIYKLLELVEEGGNYTINGKPFRLSHEDEETIKQAIIAIKEDTYAGGSKPPMGM